MVQALEPMKANAARAPLAVKQRTITQQELIEQPIHTHQSEADVRQAVSEAITHPEPTYTDYSAYSSDDGVTVEPYIPTSSLDHLEEPVRAAEAPVPSDVPSHAERPEGRLRMPRTEELPAVARKPLVAEERHEAEPRNARASV